MSEKNKNIIEKVNEAFSKGSTDGFLEYCSEDIVWNIAGEKRIEGHDAVREFSNAGGGMEPPKFTVDKMIAEGDTVVCYGDMTMKENGIENPYSYCDIYTFEGDKIKELRTLVVKHKTEGETGKPAAA